MGGSSADVFFFGWFLGGFGRFLDGFGVVLVLDGFGVGLVGF